MSQFGVLAVVLGVVASAAAQGAPIPADSSWEQVHWARVHGSLMATGFFILLPLGSIAARYLRAYLPFQQWLSAHATIQLLLAMPIITSGFGVGVHLAMYNGQFKNPHTKIGLTLFLMYWIQLGLGILTAGTPSPALGNAENKGQPDRRHPMRARPWYAILHVFWGLSMILIASVQVRRGYKIEWPEKRGQPVSKSVDNAWIAWVIIIPVIYLGGLALLLRRQWAQERARMMGTSANGEKYDSVATSSPNANASKPLA
ncbi:cytochrome b561 domain-containing protein [Ceratobasidium sp. AG-Ba]|nr:cytochrome b561 domain-containing protein [Ceratobasidium sp. AG-Ba]QRW09912.1 cytochrome b561 domain-containing protein [Ceratobasidium sp. AG-Ba]